MMKNVDVNRVVQQLHAGFRCGDPAVDAKTHEKACVETLVANYKAIGENDFLEALSCFHSDVEMEIYGPPGTPFVGRWKGFGQVARALKANFALIDVEDVQVESVVAQGDSVVVLARETGCFRATGKRYGIRWVQWFRFHEGKIIHFRELLDSAALAAAAQPAASAPDASAPDASAPDASRSVS